LQRTRGREISSPNFTRDESAKTTSVPATTYDLVKVDSDLHVVWLDGTRIEHGVACTIIE